MARATIAMRAWGAPPARSINLLSLARLRLSEPRGFMVSPYFGQRILAGS